MSQPMKSVQLVISTALVLAVNFAGRGNNDLPRRESVARHSEDGVRLFLARNCLECHGGQKPKGHFRVDQLLADFADKTNRHKWQAVLKRVKAGEMPPKSKPR